MNNKNGFALIEILVVVALISILSAVGVITYNGYISNAQDKKAQSNFNQIVKTMNNELANCRINPSARLFNSQYCNSLFEPDVNAISSFFNTSTLTNPYNKNENVDSAIYETKIVINLIRGMYYGNSEFKEFIEKYPNAEVD